MQRTDQQLTNLKVQLNRRELQLINEQETAQNKRTRQLKYVRDPLERKRLKNIHAIERARFSEKLRLVSKEHQMLVEQYIAGKDIVMKEQKKGGKHCCFPKQEVW